MEPLGILYLAFSALALATVLGFVTLNSLSFARAVEHSLPQDADEPRVSVLVPARNEERVIRQCLASLDAQNYSNYEIILLDDRSDDRTTEIARELGFGVSGPRRILNGQARPDEWTGKAWACHQLSMQADGEFLLFTDADTRHDPDCLRAAIGTARTSRADLLSLWPEQQTVTLSEKLVIPLVYLLILGFLPQFLLRFLQRHQALARKLPSGWLHALGAANGQFMLFKKEAYHAVGGHRAVADHLVEDVALGRLVARQSAKGRRLVNADGRGAVSCRMYRSTRELWEGFTKNLRPAFDNSTAAFLFSLAVQFLAFILPFLLLPFSSSPVWTAFLLALVATIYLIRAILTARFQTSPIGAALHPVAHAFALAIALNSWRKWSGQGVTWKGETYQKRKDK